MRYDPEINEWMDVRETFCFQRDDFVQLVISLAPKSMREVLHPVCCIVTPQGIQLGLSFFLRCDRVREGEGWSGS